MSVETITENNGVLYERALLVKYGEIALRGKNRGLYENMLIDAIVRNIKHIGKYTVKKEQGRFLIREDSGNMDYEQIITAVTYVFGVVGVCPCYMTEDQSIENLFRIAVAQLISAHKDTPFTFKVETSRSDKRYPMLSGEISAAIGEYVLNNMPNAKVNVRNPQTILRVELRNAAYIYSATVRGNGGLPPGSAGKGVLLLSGGFDSPVAGYLAAKRGIDITAVYFHSPPYTSERAKEKVKDLAERLSLYTGKFKLISIPFTDIQLKLCDSVPPEKLTILLKRIMLRIAEKIALQNGALALVTGDAVGQVASQTLTSLYAMQSAVNMPILRPLACMDKQEILDFATRIGTYEISARPYEDCCTLFVAEHPETRPKASIIENIEKNVLFEIEEMMTEAIANAQKFYF